MARIKNLMDDITLDQYSIHHINVDGNLITKPQGTDSSGLETFSHEILEGVFTSNRGKAFTFDPSTEEVSNLVRDMLNGGWDTSSEMIANRLLRAEKSRQEEMAGFQQVKKGSLLQLKLNSTNDKFIIFTKVDHGKYMDEVDSLIHTGLPFEKRVQKTCVFKFTGSSTTPESINIFDSNNTISKYWRHDFLCCQEVNTSEDNTKVAFNAIDNILSRNVLPKSKPDYTYLRNSVITYFRSNESMEFDNFVEEIIRNYPVIDSSVDIEDIAKKIEALPQRKGFDTQFEIHSKVISARIKRVVVLADNFELNIKGEVQDLNTLVDTGSDGKGKFLKIYSDQGHDEFNRIKRDGQ